IDHGPYGFEHVNAAKQRRDPNSMLNWTERIIRMRKEVPEIGWGDFKVIATRDPAVLVIRYDWRNNSVLFVHNLDQKPREVSFAAGLPGDEGKLLVNLLSEDHSHAGGRGKHTLMLEGYGYRWYRVGGLDYLLKRSDIDTDATGKNSHPAGAPGVPMITPSLPRKSSVPWIFSPCLSSTVESRISPRSPAASDAIETGSAPRFSAITTALSSACRRYSNRSPSAATG